MVPPHILHYYPGTIPIFQIVGHHHTAPHGLSPLVHRGVLPEKRLVWFICGRYICRFRGEPSSRQVGLTFSCCIRADDLLRLVATSHTNPLVTRNLGVLCTPFSVVHV